MRTWYTSNQGYIQAPPAGMERKPDGLDWERWLGPGPKVAWNPDIFFSPYKWLHYDGGMIMGIGIHVIDTAHFILGVGKPSAASAGGGIYHYAEWPRHAGHRGGHSRLSRKSHAHLRRRVPDGAGSENVGRRRVARYRR